MTIITVPRALLEQWKQAVNTLAALSLKAERYKAGTKLKQSMAAELAKPVGQAPAWHDAPTCAGMWVRVPPNKGVHLVDVYGVPHAPDGARWFGPIPPDGERS